MLWLTSIPFSVSASNWNIECLNYSIATNRSFKVNLRGQPVFFRIGRDNPEEVGIHRATEIKSYLLAANLGIAPKLLGYELENGLLIAEYIEGASPSEYGIRHPDTIKKVVCNLQVLHSSSIDLSELAANTVFSRNRDLLERLRSLDLVDILPDEMDRWLSIRDSFEAEHYRDIPLGICHGDLFRGNMIQAPDEKLYFVDWEYSFWGYVIDDLGKFCSSNWFNDNQIALASEMYWGEVNELLLRKLYQNIFMQQFNFFLWCRIQALNHLKERVFLDEMVNRVRIHLNKMSVSLL